MKLMDIDSDTLSIPETEYDARVTLPASEFARIVRDLSQLGESVRIEGSKEGVRFAADGEAANGSVLLRQSDNAPPPPGPSAQRARSAKSRLSTRTVTTRKKSLRSRRSVERRPSPRASSSVSPYLFTHN